MFQNLVKSGRTLKNYSIAIARRMMAYDTAPATSEATTAVRAEESMSSKTSEAVGGEASKAANDKIIHRVKVLNLPTHEVANVKKLFTSLGLKRHKKAPAWDYAFLTFETEEAAKEAMEKLNGLEFKKQKLATEYITISEEAYRKRFQGKKRTADEAQQEDTRPPAERLADQVTPLHKMPYEKQLQKKHKIGLKHLTTLKRKISQLTDLSDNAKAQIAWAFQKGPDLPFEVLDPIASPDVYGYRSKCEFTIGRNPDGERTVGFLLGLYRHGITSVLSPESCLHVPDVSKRIAKAMEDYVRESDYDVYDRVDKVGVWRTMMVKAQRTGDVLILIQLKSAEMTDEQLAAEKEKLVAYWSSFKDKPESERINVSTLLLQVWNGDSNGVTDKGQTEVLLGDGYVYEELLGCRFRISSSAFFQINTAATELLYKKCAEWCNIDASKKTTLLDLCCGTGTIGITMAKSVDRVVGIEMVPDAIVDAKANAELNNVTNVTYYASKVEDKIDIVSNESNEDVVAVLDPPRNGVHSSVIRAVRESPQIQRVVFISCDANQAMQNFISLCRPTSNRFRGLPFKPTRAVSIDLFPHTDHCELMIEFVRIKE